MSVEIDYNTHRDGDVQPTTGTPMTVPIEAAVRMSATSPIQHMCPFVHEVDNGTITVGWDADGWTFELHALRAYLGTFAGREISHEELTAEVKAELSGHYGIEDVSVSTAWDTAGMAVKCATSQIPVAQL